MNQTIIAAALLAAVTGSAAHAADLTLTSDYRYRGISQTRLQPALQAGAEAVDAGSGLYAGAWGSTIQWTRDAGGAGRVELDLYGGKRGQLGAASYDVGVLTYVYQGRIPGLANPDTTELYAQLGMGPATLKYSHAVTTLFGFVDSKHSGYLDLGANLDAGDGYSVNLHAGHQHVRGNSAASYSDWKIGISKDAGFAVLQLAAIGTNADKAAYTAKGKFLGKNALQLTATRSF